MNFLALREELRQKFNEICLEFDSVPPPQLLHYTSPTGFRGIVESGTIWCTDIRHVNDPREGDHGLEVLKAVLQRKSVPKEFLEAVLRSQDLFGLKRLCTSYVASFSSGLEEAYLWTDYAAKGTGCALIFDYSALDEGAEEGRKYAVVRTLYDSAAQLCKMRQIVDHAIQVQRRCSLSSHDAAQFWNTEVAFSLLNCGMLFKETKWDREREFRLVVMGGDDVKPFSVEGRPRVALQFDRGAIVGVVRGPNAGNQLQAECIRTLLQRCGYAESLPIRDAISG
jgi:hypothetical protein